MRKLIRQAWEVINETLIGHFIGLLLIMTVWAAVMYLLGWLP